MIRIDPATTEDIIAFAARLPAQTIQAMAIRKDGELVAIAGVTIECSQLVAFMDVRDGVTVPKMTIWRCALKVMDRLGERKGPLFAVADPERPRARLFLKCLGFRPVDATQTVFRYHP